MEQVFDPPGHSRLPTNDDGAGTALPAANLVQSGETGWSCDDWVPSCSSGAATHIDSSAGRHRARRPALITRRVGQGESTPPRVQVIISDVPPPETFAAPVGYERILPSLQLVPLVLLSHNRLASNDPANGELSEP